MTNFDKFKNFSRIKLAQWLDKYGQFEDSPWMNWWNEHYCNKCEVIKGTVEGYINPLEFSYCEIYDQCRFFSDMNEPPNNEEIIEMWLEQEAEDEQDY